MWEWVKSYILLFQAQKLIQCPLGILSKAAPILTEDNFIDIMPVAWELMTESDQELSAAAGVCFIFVLISMESSGTQS